MATMIDTTGLADYTMREGDGPSKILAQDGNYTLLIKSATIGESQESKNTTLRLTLVVQDEDERGAILYKTLPVTGLVESGQNAGQPNVRQLGDLLTSTGRDPAYIANLAAAKKFDIELIAKELNGVTAYCFVQQGFNHKDALQSDCRFWIRKEKYEESKQSGANYRRKPNPTGGRRGATAGTPVNGAARAAAPATQVNDKMAADV